MQAKKRALKQAKSIWWWKKRYYALCKIRNTVFLGEEILNDALNNLRERYNDLARVHNEVVHEYKNFRDKQPTNL